MKSYIAYGTRVVNTRREDRGIVYKGWTKVPLRTRFFAPPDVPEGELRRLGGEALRGKWKSAIFSDVRLPSDEPPKLHRLFDLGYI